MTRWYKWTNHRAPAFLLQDFVNQKLSESAVVTDGIAKTEVDQQLAEMSVIHFCLQQTFDTNQGQGYDEPPIALELSDVLNWGNKTQLIFSVFFFSKMLVDIIVLPVLLFYKTYTWG